MKLSIYTKLLTGFIAMLCFIFLYAPISIVVLASFNKLKSFAIPKSDEFTNSWWVKAFENEGIKDALTSSLKIALFATIIALIVGTIASLALNRASFFGKTTLNLFIVLPISLPGIITGIAIGSSFLNLNFKLGMTSVIIAHSTFCIVIVFNNALARLKRIGSNLSDASADLGAGQWRTFRKITLPLISSALVAGALLSFALSFDEIVVTTFTSGSNVQTLPQWIYSNVFRPNNLPLVNVAATFVIACSLIPVVLAQKLTSKD